MATTPLQKQSTELRKRYLGTLKYNNVYVIVNCNKNGQTKPNRDTESPDKKQCRQVASTIPGTNVCVDFQSMLNRFRDTTALEA
jgi:hypothetical protein